MIWNIGNGKRPNGNPGKIAFGEPGKICLTEVSGSRPKPCVEGGKGEGRHRLHRDDRKCAGENDRQRVEGGGRCTLKESPAVDEVKFHC